MARKEEEEPLYAEPSIIEKKPGAGGFFAELLDNYSPPTEPFKVVLRGGECFLFRAMESDLAWQGLQDEAQKAVIRLAKGLPPSLSDYFDMPKTAKGATRAMFVFLLYRTMVGWYPDSVESEDGTDIDPIGEMRPPLTLEEWFKFSRKSPTVFDGIQSKVDAGQIRRRKATDAAEVKKEKKD